MNDSLHIFLSGVTGVALGILYFGGLWLTVREGLRSSRPALWFLLSLLIRTALLLAAFQVISHGDWRNYLACVAGFSLGRLILGLLVRRTKGAPCT